MKELCECTLGSARVAPLARSLTSYVATLACAACVRVFVICVVTVDVADVVGTTQFEGVASIENSDWTDTQLSKYQRNLLCDLPSAKGVNPTTGADTRESLMCE